jgi:putative nucleotidyltransferase with HDIG domain
MSSGSPKKARTQRVVGFELPPGLWKSLWTALQRGAVVVRLALCLAAALLLLVLTRGWDPPFGYRVDAVPKRNIVARVDFKKTDPDATRDARDNARKLAVAEYDNDPEALIQLRAQLASELGKLSAAETFEDVDPDLWQSFQPPRAAGTPDPTDEQLAEQFAKLHAALSSEGELEVIDGKLSEVFAPFQDRGLLKELPPEHDANFEKIVVRKKDSPAFGVQVPVAEVRIKDASAKLQQALSDKIAPPELAASLFAWFEPRLPETLAINLPATRKAQEKEAAATPEVTKLFTKGKDVLAEADEPLTQESLTLLRLEHEAEVAERSWGRRVLRSFAVLGMYAAIYTLAGFYVFRRDRRIIDELPRFALLLGLMVLTISLAVSLNGYAWGSDVIPVLLFAMIVAIAYRQETSLILSICVILSVVLSIGHQFVQSLVLTATTAGAIIVLKRVRTRTKLLSVGFVAALVGLLTTFGAGALYDRPWSSLMIEGFLVALWSIIAGSLMTVLLPTVEKLFGVQTDLSLIELGDPAHPLLQELVRRAPGTYNHSITVASLAEAAAEAIGARGLLVRVGAYFHDIGKMLKPGYFVENQAKGDNRHDALVPAMSTLVIIAHVKDGADLARQNHLPEAIVDFIQQHHGTTLVEYFYRQANQRRAQEDPDGSELDESSFRYPGPKPQTREAAVLMIADAVESASRVLKEPTPGRIENLVEEISMKRLLDGQFDECGLTLEELRKIGESLVKSLTAVYHGRVVYPDQATA